MKSLFAVGAKRLMAADPLLWGFSIDDVFKKKAEGKTSMEAMGSLLFLDKPIRKGLKRLKADDQQKLIRERDIETEEALTLPPEKVAERGERYKSWKSIPVVQAVEEYLKSDEQKAKDFENLLNV